MRSKVVFLFVRCKNKESYKVKDSIEMWYDNQDYVKE